MSSASAGGHGRSVTFVAFGLLIAVGIGLLWWATSQQVGEPPTPASERPTNGPLSPGATGDVAGPTAQTPRPPADQLSEDTTPGVTGRAGEAVAPAPEGSSQTPVPAPAMSASPPVHVSIPTINVESPLHALGLNDDGTLQVPSGERYDQAAWYDGSPTPGETGPAIIEGHVTSSGSVPSVFFDLGALVPGDQVAVERQDGSTATFEVYGAETFPKDEFPKATVYGNTQGPELRLITCGGAYDPELGAHVDNIVVFARLVTEP